MKKVFNFIVSYILLQLIHCNGSFLPYLIKTVKKSQVNNLDTYKTIKAKIFCLNCYQISLGIAKKLKGWEKPSL